MPPQGSYLVWLAAEKAAKLAAQKAAKLAAEKAAKAPIPTIPPLDVHRYWQSDSHWTGQYVGEKSSGAHSCSYPMGYAGRTRPVGWGCAITALAMVLNFYNKTIPGGPDAGKTVDPGNLNHYLGDKNMIDGPGKNYCGIGSWLKVGNRFSITIPRDATPTSAKDWPTLRKHRPWLNIIANNLNKGWPLIAGVNGASHFVVITGLTDGDNGNVKINDPADVSRTDLFPHYSLFSLRTT